VSVGLGLMARQTTLRERDAERAVLDRLLEALRTGESRTLVVRGEPGPARPPSRGLASLGCSTASPSPRYSVGAARLIEPLQEP
jgi:hypothetical protein